MASTSGAKARVLTGGFYAGLEGLLHPLSRCVLFLFALILLGASIAAAQSTQDKDADKSGPAVKKGQKKDQKKDAAKDASKDKDKKEEEKKGGMTADTFSGLKFRSIGPAVASGRVMSIAVNPRNKVEYFVGVASGGVWKTVNGGTTWIPVFDK
jgi:hypothetical protein